CGALALGGPDREPGRVHHVPARGSVISGIVIRISDPLSCSPLRNASARSASPPCFAVTPRSVSDPVACVRGVDGLGHRLRWANRAEDIELDALAHLRNGPGLREPRGGRALRRGRIL